MDFLLVVHASRGRWPHESVCGGEDIMFAADNPAVIHHGHGKVR